MRAKCAMHSPKARSFFDMELPGFAKSLHGALKTEILDFARSLYRVWACAANRALTCCRLEKLKQPHPVFTHMIRKTLFW